MAPPRHAPGTSAHGRSDPPNPARDRWRVLLSAQLEVSDAHDLTSTLERTCAQASRLVGAPGAALVLLGAEGEVVSTAHHGLSPAAVDLTGGRAVTDAVERRGAAAAHDATPHHLDLEVEIDVSGGARALLKVVGTPNHGFSDEDRELLQAFAAAISSALSHALVVDDLAYRGQWSAMLADAARHVSSGESDEISVLIQQAAELADAQLINVVSPTRDRDRLVVSHAVGVKADDLIGLSVPRAGSLAGSVIEEGRPRTEEDLARWIDPTLDELRRLGPGLAVPFEIDRVGSAVLVLARDRRLGRFRSRDAEMAQALAAHVGVLAAQEGLRRAQRRLVLLEERQRIAQDLHDHVIQRLFAVGLGLDMVGSRLDDRDVVNRLGDLRKEVQGTISQVRRSVLSLARTGEPSTLPDRVTEVVGAVRGFSVSPTLAFSGPVDAVVDGALLDDVSAVVREALTNAVRHGRATTAHVMVVVAGDRLTVTVVNDGRSFRKPESSPAISGLANMRRRAQWRGGSLDIRQPDTAPGARLRWSVLLPVVADGQAGPNRHQD